jgi:hypothetical protein
VPLTEVQMRLQNSRVLHALGISSARWAAIVGLGFALPFLALNLVVAERIEPLFSIVRPGEHTGILEYPLLAIVVSLLPVGAAVALSPMWREGGDGSRGHSLANIVVAALLITCFLVIAIVLGGEIYRCDVLHMPNCD